MKKAIFLLAGLFAVALLRAQTTATTQPETDVAKVVDFKELDHDFGKIPQGKPAEFDLYMKNISSDSVTITSVPPSCGCTTPKWQPGPYAPGETFKITVGYNAGQLGVFAKMITVYFKGGLSRVIRFHGETFAAPANPAPASPAQQIKPAPVNN